MEFFQGAKFVVTPCELEIESGILFPGHRFAPFCSPDIYVSEVSLLAEESGIELKTKMFACNMLEIMPQHALLGSEQLYDYVMAESQDNSAFLQGEHSAKVKLEVFDLARFYAKHEFSTGDALVFTVDDYDNGEFSFSYLSASKRSEQGRDLWINRYENALQKAITANSEYEDVPEILADGLFCGGAELFDSAAASLDEFIALSEVIELKAGENGTVLAIHNEFSESSYEDELPEGVSASAGKTDSLESIMKDAGSSLSQLELDAFIFDAYASSDVEVDNLYRRLFEGELNFADEAQEAWFRVLLEERFEYMQDKFDRQNDHEIAETRTAVLELIEQRLSILDSFKSVEEAIPEDIEHELSICSQFYNTLLSIILTPGYAPDSDADYDALMDTLDTMAARQEQILARMGGAE